MIPTRAWFGGFLIALACWLAGCAREPGVVSEDGWESVGKSVYTTCHRGHRLYIFWADSIAVVQDGCK